MWAVMQSEQNGKWCAYAYKLSRADNIVWIIERDRVKTANYCRNKKEALEMAEHFNDCHKQNGNYLFDEPKF